MNRLSSILIPVSFALAVGACGGGASSPSDALHDSIRSGCQKEFDCMSEYDPAMHNGDAFADSYGSSVDDCVTQTEAFITAFLGANYFDKLDASVDAGRLDFNSDNAAACDDAFAAASCDEIFDQNGATYTQPAVCDTVLVGTVDDGGSCTLDQECSTSGDSCDGTSMTCMPAA
jgi:hypothetical protein